MATSGTYNFSIDIAEVIDEAYERCGVDPQTLEGYSLKSARRSLNLMFTQWAVAGINYWATEEITLNMIQGQSTYTLPGETVDIISAVLRRDGSDTELERSSLEDYNNLPNKSESGRPTQFFFDRQTIPEMRVWLVPENSTDQIVYWQLKQLQDVSTANEDPDVPYRWLEAMCAGLAAKLAVKKAPDRLAMLKVEAQEAFDLAADDENERASLKITPASVL